MSNIKLNCCICGKELGLGNRVSSDGVLWRCEDCARKQREEYDNKDKKISDLEAKLAESEERVKDLEFRNKNLEHSLKVAPNANAGQRQRIVELKEINHKLKQQLAEKEKEIGKLKSENHALMSDNAYQEAEIFELTQKLAIQNQDKISFAVEKLEKVKEYLVLRARKIKEYNVNVVRLYSANKFIDNQIKQLKEGK